MADAQHKSTRTCPSLYATINLAHLVQKVRQHLKSCIKKYAPSVELTNTVNPRKLTINACNIITDYVRPDPRLRRHLGQSRTRVVSDRPTAEVASLLNKLDLHTQEKHFSLRRTAAQDSLFIKHDFRPVERFRSKAKSYHIYEVSTALLNRLQGLPGSHVGRQCDDNDSESDLAGIDLKGERFIANLEHMLRCLQQIALESIIRHYLHIVKAHVLHWQHQKRIGEGWFAEWPNGQPPLNTTWPWNVKPCLLVLWGVCWMFYGNNKRTARNPRETAPATVSEDFRTGPIGQQSPPRQQQSQNPSQAWTDTTSNTFSYSWLHPQQAGVDSRRANDPIPNALPSYPVNVSSYPYITPQSNVTSDLFPTSTASWPYCQGIHTDPLPAYASNYTPWQSTLNQTGLLSAPTQRIEPSTPAQSYGTQPQATPSRGAIGSLGNFGFGLGLHMSDMQDYPSPHSDVSGQTSSSCLSVLPGAVISPNMPLVASPSLAGSSTSRQSSRRSQEAPRNAEGMLYCNNPECARQPPVFSRKCEWTKHMDKHNRPYVCDEPGCENIRGFTYSGGLLRHQREVHRQHGGPKASCMCPHPDCKRSTGAGFSRKENLHEHLRRVHRDVSKLEPEDSSPDVISTGTRKRRRPARDDGGRNDDDDDEDNDEDLQQEVKKLRRELEQKDERLKRLEQVVAKLAKGKAPSSSGA